MKKLKILAASLLFVAMVSLLTYGISYDALAGNKLKNFDENKPTLIVDTDLSDTDDLYALRMLTSEIVLSNFNLVVTSCVSGAELPICGVLNSYGLLDMVSVGMAKPGLNVEASDNNYWDTIDCSGVNTEDMSESFELMREAVLQSKEGCIILTLGYVDNVDRLVREELDLVRENVKAIHIVGGDLGANFWNDSNFFFTESAMKSAQHLLKTAEIEELSLIVHTHEAGALVWLGAEGKLDPEFDRALIGPFQKMRREVTGGPGWDALALLIVIDTELNEASDLIIEYTPCQLQGDELVDDPNGRLLRVNIREESTILVDKIEELHR